LFSDQEKESWAQKGRVAAQQWVNQWKWSTLPEVQKWVAYSLLKTAAAEQPDDAWKSIRFAWITSFAKVEMISPALDPRTVSFPCIYQDRKYVLPWSTEPTDFFKMVVRGLLRTLLYTAEIGHSDRDFKVHLFIQPGTTAYCPMISMDARTQPWSIIDWIEQYVEKGYASMTPFCWKADAHATQIQACLDPWKHIVDIHPWQNTKNHA
jgi:hypothetical protein